MLIQSFAALILALLAFLASTRQVHLVVRALTWLAGIACLAAAVVFGILQTPHAGLFAVLSDLWSQRSHPQQSILVSALGANWSGVGSVIGPMLDLLVALAAIVGIASLFAFTPGERTEKVVRPLAIGLVGAVAGACIVLVITGVGFGGQSKRYAYLNFVTAGDVIDGDTLRMGDVTLRLYGIDALEHSPRSQICRQGAAPYERFDCGAQSKAALSEAVVGKLLYCGAPLASGPKKIEIERLKETFGRPIVSCWTRLGELKIDTAAVVARKGYADLYRDGGEAKSTAAIQDAALRAKQLRVGMWSAWTLSPDDWRSNKACREWFTAETWTPPASGSGIVPCPEAGVTPPDIPAAANDNVLMASPPAN